MDFDWESCDSRPEGSLKVQEVEESFEDPFAVRLLPDAARFADQARYFNLGRATEGRGVFTVYRTNGKQFQIILARPFEPEENFFYERQQAKLLHQG
ncbi:MAG: hypothetical protein CMO74_04975 [Verrucomicrobiales bacterium]|nr:hypothetical protein [Verrucomicrobiales bacterium]|tara:strand:- start:483 stop:773 length:291 start_codon:yes stop_codon:yes gene_type:complete